MVPAESQAVSTPVASSAAPQTMTVEVAVGVAPRQVKRVRLDVPTGSTVRQALEASGVLGQIPGLSPEEIIAGEWVIGVWGRKERLGHVLRDQDRIELVRPLLVDPKEARRVRYKAHTDKWPKGAQRLPNKKPADQA